MDSLTVMRYVGYIFLVILCLTTTTMAVTTDSSVVSTTKATTIISLSHRVTKKLNVTNRAEKKITAALLAITLGPLGVHRLYLGCSPVVPAAYVATLGGGIGIIPLLDLIAILTTRDITKYELNNRVIMWVDTPIDKKKE